MKNILNGKSLVIGEKKTTPFRQKRGIYQDGTTPCFRDTDGRLWAMSGHTHAGHIGMFCGSTMADLKEVYPIAANFETGAAGKAFNNVKYPEGISSRGSIWPFGLYICPKTHRFFAFFHNETGWNGKGTAYDSFGYCEKPLYDSDFRHIGLMHSDDEGRSWMFDRWVLTAEHICCSEKFIPERENVIGQKTGVVGLGSGDFSLYVDPNSEYIYVFYNILYVDMNSGELKNCDVYAARTRKRSDGMMGDFVKYYNGEFCEAGNLGKESPVAENAWHARVLYLREEGMYMMSSTFFRRHAGDEALGETERVIELRFGNDLLHWSEPVQAEKDGKAFGDHYCAFYSAEKEDGSAVSGDKLYIQLNGNGTDVVAYEAEFKKEE